MADRLYLSIWLKNPNRENQLFRFERLMRAFPFSKLARSESVLRILAVDFTQPPVAETLLTGEIVAERVSALAKEFHSADSAFQLDAFWDIWRYERKGSGFANPSLEFATPRAASVLRDVTEENDDWTLAPAPVSIYSFASDFDREDNEDFRIEFGLDTQFLPDSGTPGGMRMIQSNIRSLLSLVHDVENRLPVAKRLLWSESGENFAELLQQKLVAVSQDLQ